MGRGPSSLSLSLPLSGLFLSVSLSPSRLTLALGSRPFALHRGYRDGWGRQHWDHGRGVLRWEKRDPFMDQCYAPAEPHACGGGIDDLILLAYGRGKAASGAVQCQMMDMVHPGIVPMHKVNFDARTEYEMIQNYKLLQEVFNKLKIEKHVEVNKLVKGRPLDNLEFLQWLKRYCDSVNGGMMNENYHPVERRCKGGKEKIIKGLQRTSKSFQSNNLGNRVSTDGAKQGKVSPNANMESYTAQIQELSDKIRELTVSLDGMEKERDFYYEKLRLIEILCQKPELEHLPMTKAVLKILYADDSEKTPLPEAEEFLSESLDAGDLEAEQSD
ncbi:Microtubule-associated protein RP/EB family member 1B [Apostasia shenzhenica]|uniref:Microtubule-associated protein RP/EB family member 1B n=1 Tax=Apostasia shenzhenica TaxID=1088818 RepID=A0A2I0A5A4_9ASPA|nr:Microtubule-associated protein RP/EB family member 1B [Apostasia shenzhenica]